MPNEKKNIKAGKKVKTVGKDESGQTLGEGTYGKVKKAFIKRRRRKLQSR